ncbi:hypothetical protein Tco_1102807 [Tanacetum coccineum]
MDEELRESYRTPEKSLFHEERIVTPSFISKNNMLPFFQVVGLEPFLTLNEPICPRFVVEFYHSLKVKRDEEQRPYIEFKLGQLTFKLTSSQLSRILQTPYALETFYTSKWSLNSLDDHPNSNFFGPKHDLNPSKEKRKKIVSPSVIGTTLSSSSLSSNDNEAPYFLEFYDELSDNEDLTKAQREKIGMLKCLNRYVGTITKYLEKKN